ncbi:NUDIX hydrolase [Chloroflexota bacterium]
MGEIDPAGLSEEWIRHRLFGLSTEGNKNRSTSGLLDKSPSDDDLKCAAVLIPLIYHDSNWSLIFTRRTELLESHKGQVSFPGGACDLNEVGAEDTALREAWEEIGLISEDVTILGMLPEVETITSFRVTPVVGIIPWPYHFTLSKQEVSRVFAIPLEWLIESSNWVEQKITSEDFKKEYSLITYLPYDGEILWGASARITHDFLKALELI